MRSMTPERQLSRKSTGTSIGNTRCLLRFARRASRLICGRCERIPATATHGDGVRAAAGRILGCSRRRNMSMHGIRASRGNANGIDHAGVRQKRNMVSRWVMIG